MDTARVALIREAIAKGGPGATPAAYEKVRAKLLAKALTREEVIAKSEELAEGGIALDRAAFRDWMRVQAAAEQGHRFGKEPGMTIEHGE